MFIDPEPVVPDIMRTRPQIIKDINKRAHFDVAVIGGGIHGAAVARLAALNGLSTVLLEMADYASGTSSRSSKLAHGGLRYLAMGDFRQVYESVKAREELYLVAPHLVRPYPFLIPVAKGAWWQRAQYAVGLSLYEMGQGSKQRCHSWLSATVPDVQQAFAGKSHELSGCYQYYDGIMSDTRLVIETILAARQEGAYCLNYARVDSVAQQATGEVHVGWTDVRQDGKYQLRAGIVINCAGPWAPSVGRLQALPHRVRYSRGSHLIFSVPWEKPALFLPLEGKNRFYFILPHPAGTLVGTTERECGADLPLDPNPTCDEVEEILARLARDVPEQKLDRSTLCYGFAGIRTLPVRGEGKETAAISRRHRWELQGGMLTLYGGKYTSAYWTAFEGLRQVERLTGAFSLKGVGERLLPGAFRAQEELSETLSKCQSDEQRDAVRATHQLFGGQLRHMIENDSGIESLRGKIIKGAIEYACRYEQVETLEDLMRRRLELEFFPDAGEALLARVTSIYAQIKGDSYQENELQQYRNRLSELRRILGIGDQ